MHVLRFSSLLLILTGLGSAPVWAASLQDNPAGFDPQASLQFGLDVQAFSDPIPLLRLNDDDWGRRLKGRHQREHAFLDGWAIAGAEEQGWHMSVLARRYGVAHANQDTVLLAQQIEQRLPFNAGQRYALDYGMDYWTGRGFRLGKSFSFPIAKFGQLDAGLAVQYLKSVDFKTENFVGVAQANANQQLEFTGRRETAGSLMNTSDLTRFNRFVAAGNPSGYGYALDIGLRWRGANGWQAELAGFDLAARIKGRDIPRSYQSGSFLYSKDGDLIGNADGSPAVLGRDSRGDLALRPKANWLADLRWRGTQWQGGLAWRYVDGLSLPRLHGEYLLMSENWLGLAYTPRTGLVECSLSNPWLALSLASSNASVNQARALAMGFRLTLPFQPW
ncbi:hypothetical protein [Chitinimonas sp. BJB300]|uniref:hypothetical protein n=1 Tax=Chitinimonas sp. BJB300 TaxID=1559339 RepID=UPI000C0D1653|nr:hypothetical protein [Chitinimonas sp. BJB300]PHV09756.1 hypothetical protein CSQ89_19940 [Chitinimonas sp. BJB300]TSJ90747.1 hypothetical protein FG002_000010 [Chitinimonas sp. BJB300]